MGRGNHGPCSGATPTESTVTKRGKKAKKNQVKWREVEEEVGREFFVS